MIGKQTDLCPYCDSANIVYVADLTNSKDIPFPYDYWCLDCRQYFDEPATEKLYIFVWIVWECEITFAVALASSAESAREMIRQKYSNRDYILRDIEAEPEVYGLDTPFTVAENYN